MGVLLLLFLAACTTPAVPTPSSVPPSPSVTSVATYVANTPRELAICLTDEPQSLYRYARPEAGREHILAALYDGPIDYHDFRYEPVLLTKLPSIADGDAVINTVTVNKGDTVVDELGRVVPLEKGVVVNLSGGEQVTYGGEGSLQVPQMVVTFHLKPGVLWSDGVPLTASDSQYSFEVASGPEAHDPRRAAAERTASYYAMDADVAVWTGLPGYLDPLYFTNFWPPLPHHVYRSLDPNEVGANEEVNRQPPGWGPFVLKEWVAGDHLTFERNPNYFRAAEGLPRLATLTYRIVPDPAQILADLREGKCDLAPSSPSLESIADGLREAQALGELNVQVGHSATLEHLDFGIVPAGDYERSVGNSFFSDARARQAFAFCLDRDALIPGYAMTELPDTYLPAAHPLHAPGTAAYSFDPARGRALLAELGWSDSDGDGVLDKDGGALKLTLAGGPAGSTFRETLLAQIQSQLKDNCGIETELRLLTRGEMEGDWADGVIFGRRFDLAEFGWRVASVPPCELLTTAQIPSGANPGGANDTGYSHPDFDAACRAALTTFDPQRAADYHAEAQRLFARDLPMLPLFFRLRLAAARLPVVGFVLDASSESELWNIEAVAMLP